MSTFSARPPGLPVPKVDKRAIESILYTIDISELLIPGELAVAIEPNSSNKIELKDLKIKLGKAIEVRIPASTVTNALITEYNVTILFKTTLDNIRSAVFSLKIHKN